MDSEDCAIKVSTHPHRSLVVGHIQLYRLVARLWRVLSCSRHNPASRRLSTALGALSVVRMVHLHHRCTTNHPGPIEWNHLRNKIQFNVNCNVKQTHSNELVMEYLPVNPSTGIQKLNFISYLSLTKLYHSRIYRYPIYYI